MAQFRISDRRVVSRDNSRLILEDFGSVGGLYEVTGESGNSRNVVNLERIMDAPSDDDIRTLVNRHLTRF